MESLQEADDIACLASQFRTELGPAQPQLVSLFLPSAALIMEFRLLLTTVCLSFTLVGGRDITKHFLMNFEESLLETLSKLML